MPERLCLKPGCQQRADTMCLGCRRPGCVTHVRQQLIGGVAYTNLCARCAVAWEARFKREAPGRSKRPERVPA